MTTIIEPAIPSPTSTVRKALYAAQRDVEAVAKGDVAKVEGVSGAGKTYSYSYKFTSSEDMLAHCREVLHRHGLTWEMAAYDVGPPLHGLKTPTLWADFELVHAESGEILTRRYPMPLGGRNDDDKKIAGACTYLLGHATRLLLLVPRVSEEDAAQNPDRRTDEDHPRSERRVTPGPKSATQIALPDPERSYTDTELGRLRDDCGKLAPIAGRTLDKTAADMRKAAGLPAGTLTGAQLARYRKWMIDSIDIAGGTVPDWARDGDPLDQRQPAAIDEGA